MVDPEDVANKALFLKINLCLSVKLESLSPSSGFNIKRMWFANTLRMPGKQSKLSIVFEYS